MSARPFSGLPIGSGGGQYEWLGGGDPIYLKGAGASCSGDGNDGVGGGGGSCDGCEPGEFYLLPNPLWGGLGCMAGWLRQTGPCATPVWPDE